MSLFQNWKIYYSFCSASHIQEIRRRLYKLERGTVYSNELSQNVLGFILQNEYNRMQF